MSITANLRLHIERLESLLSREFSGRGKDLSERAINADIPQDLRELLKELADGSSHLEAEWNADEFAEFMFRCGRAYERLSLLASTKLAEEFAPVQTDGNLPPEVNGGDLERFTRFRDLRDRVMKSVSEWTLKILLGLLVLLILGVLIGII